jgi:peptidoglycan/LPS O-acetylase OafA/YrhL
VLLFTLASVTLLSFAVCLWSSASNGTFAFYELPARAWEFGIGGLFALRKVNATSLKPIVLIAAGWVGIAAILGSAYGMAGGSGFPGWIAAIPVLGTVAALAAGRDLPHRRIVACCSNTHLPFH